MNEFKWQGYKNAIETEFSIVDKEGKVVNFILNKPQEHFLEHITGRDYVLKARQQGFSALILAVGAVKFIYGENERCVSISHEAQATQRLLDRVKYYISSHEKRHEGYKVALKYNSRSELVNAQNNSTFYIGTAGSREFGRGDTISFLHMSELNFYPDPEKLLAGIMQAVTPNGLVFIETTANGFNFGKDFWDRTLVGETGFKGHFYNPSWTYTQEYLDMKKKELGRLYPQEYPSSPEEAFLTSGQLFFSNEALKKYLTETREVLREGLIYV